MREKRVLVTGGAGFIGSHLVDALMKQGDTKVTVIDNFNDYYESQVKRENVAPHLQNPLYKLIEGDIRDVSCLKKVFAEGPFHTVVHLAAMAGVRPSLRDPALYMDVNVVGTQRLLDFTVESNPKTRFVFGSSSSVYGIRSGECFNESDAIDRPLSPYAASKAACELQCYGIHHTTKLPIVCLRFFTVYGPRQRPDLAIHKFCKLIDSGEPVEVYGDGSSKRDYTYISDIIQGTTAAMTFDLQGYEVINLGRAEPCILIDMIRLIQEALGKEATIVHKPFQAGDMPYTYASIDKARELLNYSPNVSLADGIKEFVNWYTARKAHATV